MGASSTDSPWRVTFRDSESYAREFDRNLVQQGLFVPTEIMLPLRAVVEFVLVVPFSQQEIGGRGEVIYVIDPKEAARRGIQPGVGLQLLDFDLPTAQKARRIIGDELNQAALKPPEQRDFLRVPARLKVQYQGGVWNEVAMTRDISKSGLFLCTNRQFSEGSLVKISLVRSASGKDLTLETLVVRTELTELPEAGFEGIGVRFGEMVGDDRRRTNRFVSCLDLRRRSLSAASIRGVVDEAGVENIIKIFGKSGRDGELVLRQGTRAGKIGFQGGRVVRAELPSAGLFGAKAFYQMMTSDSGDFDYRACRANPAPGINQTVEELLRDGRTFKAETIEWRRRIPGERRLVPGPRFDPAAICVPVEALPLVEMLAARPSVQEVLNQLGFSELEGYRLIENLRSRGLVRLG